MRTAEVSSRQRSGGRDNLSRRLARVEGQVRGLSRLVAEGRACIEILDQIKAAQRALDMVALTLVEAHLRDDPVWADRPGRARRLEEIVLVLSRHGRGRR